MKKLLIFMLVLGMASMAWAVPYFKVADDDAAVNGGHYAPSQWVTIEVRDDNPVNIGGFLIDCITDNTGGLVLGLAGEPQTFNITPPQGFAFVYPGTLNVDNQLVEYVSAAAGNILPNELLYSFEYHIPDDAKPSDVIEIQTDWDMILWWIPKFDYRDTTFYEGPVTPVLLHVIPEPATIALLGLGGLLLRRRK